MSATKINIENVKYVWNGLLLIITDLISSPLIEHLSVLDVIQSKHCFSSKVHASTDWFLGGISDPDPREEQFL